MCPFTCCQTTQRCTITYSKTSIGAVHCQISLSDYQHLVPDYGVKTSVTKGLKQFFYCFYTYLVTQFYHKKNVLRSPTFYVK